MLRQVKRRRNISGATLRPSESASQMHFITPHRSDNKKDTRKVSLNFILVVEQSHTVECHCNTVLVTAVDYFLVTHRAARLNDVLHTALLCTLNVITEGEECIRTKCKVIHLIKPSTLLFLREYFRYGSQPEYGSSPNYSIYDKALPHWGVF